MLGPAKVRALDRPALVSLEALVPADHFYRQLDWALDLSFVRDLVRDRYAAGGRPSIDPVVFFRLQLVLFFAGLRSERQLLRVAADRLSVRWYPGYALDEALPDHSSLTRIRERTRAGLAAARARGRQGGRPKKLATPAKVAMARALYDGRRHSVAEICATLGVSRATLYRVLARPQAE